MKLKNHLQADVTVNKHTRPERAAKITIQGFSATGNGGFENAAGATNPDQTHTINETMNIAAVLPRG